MLGQTNGGATSLLEDDYLTSLCSYFLNTLKTLVEFTIETCRDDPDKAFEPRSSGRKMAARIDLHAEDNFLRSLNIWNRGRPDKIKLFGEERDRSMVASDSVAALVDALDGSDLLERGLGNWCSALLFYDPRKDLGNRILASFVAVPEPSLRIYYARHDADQAWITEDEGSRPVHGPSRVTHLRDASLCFYGQKASRLLAFFEKPLLRKVAAEGGNFRIYTMAGNPMLVRLVDKPGDVRRGIDCVLETEGQSPHDFVAGAYIAKKGGAHIRTLTGSDISYEMLDEYLEHRPEEKFSYIAAATKILANEVVESLLVTSKEEG